MKKILFLLWLISPLVAFAQANLPAWTQDAYRESNYPSSEWYTGFARDRMQAGNNAGNALKTLEKDAQNQLAESIIVTVEGDTRVENASYQYQHSGKNSEVITTNYRQAVRTATTATTVKTETKSYHDQSTGMIYAFAAVKRADLSAFYSKQIDVDLNKVENAIDVSEQLTAAGKKMNAHRKIEEAKQIIDAVLYYRDLLVAVNAGRVDENLLQTKRVRNLQSAVTQLLIKLEQSTFVYVDCSHEFKDYKNDAFSSDPGILCDIITQALSENDCSITENIDEADYELTLVTSTTQRSDGKGQYGIISYYANVRGSLYNRMTQKQTASFSILNDPDAYSAGRSPEDAATKAFKLPALKNKVLEKILSKIKN